MKASDVEYRHQTLLHLLLVGLAVSAYLFVRDDVVWALVRRHPDPAWWERLVFSSGALMMLASAIMDTLTPARYQALFARFLLALAVGQLLPVPGTALLLAGEAILIIRLLLRERSHPASQRAEFDWGPAFRRSASKWGLALSMIVFVWTLNDRIAEIGAASSVALWMALNIPTRLRSRSA